MGWRRIQSHEFAGFKASAFVLDWRRVRRHEFAWFKASDFVLDWRRARRYEFAWFKASDFVLDWRRVEVMRSSGRSQAYDLRPTSSVVLLRPRVRPRPSRHRRSARKTKTSSQGWRGAPPPYRGRPMA